LATSREQPVEAWAGTWALILAAGASRRMGTPKQLLDWEGQPLVCRAVQSAQAVLGDRVLLITGCCAGEVESATAASGVRCLSNPDWSEGIASSVRTGVAALPADSEGVLICSCDQPGVGESQLRSLLGHCSDQRVVAASYGGTAGIPAWFPRGYFSALMQLSGEQGAKSLLMKSPDRIEVSMPRAIWDLDEPADISKVARALD
jgi:molybdenum cofactor cytidylyltransferase